VLQRSSLPHILHPQLLPMRPGSDNSQGHHVGTARTPHLRRLLGRHQRVGRFSIWILRCPKLRRDPLLHAKARAAASNPDKCQRRWLHRCDRFRMLPPESNLSRSRLRNLPFHYSKRARCRDFHCFVCACHLNPLFFLNILYFCDKRFVLVLAAASILALDLVSLLRFLVTLKSSLHQQPQNLNRTLPLRFGCKDCLNASLNWSSGYTCSTAAESDPSATRSPNFW